jgi:hypothetical protein
MATRVEVRPEALSPHFFLRERPSAPSPRGFVATRPFCLTLRVCWWLAGLHWACRRRRVQEREGEAVGASCLSSSSPDACGPVLGR